MWPSMKHDSKIWNWKEKYLNLCLHCLEHSIIHYLLNSLDEVVVLFVVVVLTITTQLICLI